MKRPLAILLAASLTLPALVAGSVLKWSYDRTLDEAIGDSRQTAHILREHALRVFEAQERAMDTIDQFIQGMSWDEIGASHEVHRKLKAMAASSPHIDGLWLGRPEGIGVNSADFFPMRPTDMSARDYYEVLRERDVVHLGSVIRGYLKGNLNFNVSRRRSSPDGSFDGLILVTMSLSYFESFWESVVGDRDIAAILRADGEILARYPHIETFPLKIPSDSPFFELSAFGDFGTYDYKSSVDGEERLYAFARLDDFPAYLVVGLSRAAVLEPWWRQAALVTAIAAAATLLLGGVAQVARRRERRLSEEMQRRRQAETSLIAKEEHVAALERAETALRESEERFRMLFETLTEGVIYLDSRGHILSANRAAESILGRPLLDFAGRHLGDPSWNVVDEEGRPLPPERLPTRRALASGKVVRRFLLGLHNPSANERRWLLLDAIPQARPGDAPYGVFALFSDVTEQRRAERSQQLLISEIDHRAKNALAVVQAIMRLSARETPEDYAEAVEGRVSALARVHTLLAKNRWQGAELRALVEAELEPYVPEEEGRIRLEGPRAMLKPEAMQPLGMVLHELATNAAKHGALSNLAGRLSVSWRAAADDRLEIAWKESGLDKRSPPERTGFGSKLIQASITDQLRGTLQLHWESDGLRINLVLPASVVAESRPPQAAQSPGGGLRGELPPRTRVLLVEDNAAVALEMESTLAELQCDVVGLAGTLESAIRLAKTAEADVALLDIDLRGEHVFPVAELLAARGIPYVFSTGYSDLQGFAAKWSKEAVLRKPFSRRDLRAVLAAALSRTVTPPKETPAEARAAGRSA